VTDTPSYIAVKDATATTRALGTMVDDASSTQYPQHVLRANSAPVAAGNALPIAPGTLTLVPLRVAVVSIGGTAVTALNAGDRTKGGVIFNPETATVPLCINEITTASGTSSAGSLFCILPGQKYDLCPSANAVSVVSADSNHPFAGMGYT
jgi:hypothetical protein